MKLIIAKPSPFARKVRIVLHEKGMKFEEQVDLPWNPDSLVSDINPLGKVPVLIPDDGNAIYDSSVIIEYLETLSNEPKLIPTEPIRRVRVRQIEALADGIADAAFTESFTDVEAVDGLVATRPRPGEESNARSKFEDAYKAAGGADGAIYTGETYDAINIAAAAIVAANPDGDLLAFLKKTGSSYVGASGTHTFDSNGDVLGTGYEVCQFDGTNFSCPRIWTADSGLASK